MSQKNARDLNKALATLDTTTMAALSILAIGSGYWTYMGVRGLLDADGLLSIGGALVYSIAVSMAIFCFWAYLMKFLPMMRSVLSRLGLAVAMVIGSGAIIAMSSWLNAAALAGSAAIEQHLANAVEEYQSRFERAHENALAAQSLLPDVQIAAGRFRSMAGDEAREGALTGTAGRGTVVALLTQTADQLDQLEGQILSAREVVDDLHRTGGQHLTAMRRLVSARGAVAERSVEFAEEAVNLVGIISALQETSVAPAVRRTAEDFARSFIRPATVSGAGDLGDRQAEVIDSVAGAVSQTSAALVAAADEILARSRIEAFRFTPISSAEAVLLYAEDFVPSWAGAIAIDMMPAVLVLMLMVIHGAIRHAEGESEAVDSITLSDLTMAASALRRLHGADPAGPLDPAPGTADPRDVFVAATAASDPPPSPAPKAAATVSPIGPQEPPVPSPPAAGRGTGPDGEGTRTGLTAARG